MDSVFEISAEDVVRLTPTQLVDVLRRLLHAEAEKHGIFRSGIEVPPRITVNDDGEDGRIQWEGDYPTQI